MIPLASEPSVYVHRESDTGKLDGLSASYVIEIISAVRSVFKAIAKDTHDRFYMGPNEFLPLPFTGFRLLQCNHTPHLILYQISYLHNLNPLPTDGTF